MSITRAKRRGGSYAVGSVRRAINANAEHPPSNPVMDRFAGPNIQDPSQIKGSQVDCETKQTGVSTVRRKSKIDIRKIGISRSRECRQE
jgi:hypothetical protein